MDDEYTLDVEKDKLVKKKKPTKKKLEYEDDLETKIHRGSLGE